MEPNAQHDPDEVWVDAEAGPVVRPYAMTGGRTQPTSGRFDLVSMIMTIRSISGADAVDLGPEHETILRLCHRPASVAELSAHLDLPVGTIRVLLGDLLSRVLIVANNPEPTLDLPGDDIFETVIHGIRQL
jgi:hypothetical protein